MPCVCVHLVAGTLGPCAPVSFSLLAPDPALRVHVTQLGPSSLPAPSRGLLSRSSPHCRPTPATAACVSVPLRSPSLSYGTAAQSSAHPARCLRFWSPLLRPFVWFWPCPPLSVASVPPAGHFWSPSLVSRLSVLRLPVFEGQIRCHSLSSTRTKQHHVLKLAPFLPDFCLSRNYSCGLHRAAPRRLPCHGGFPLPRPPVSPAPHLPGTCRCLTRLSHFSPFASCALARRGHHC